MKQVALGRRISREGNAEQAPVSPSAWESRKSALLVSGLQLAISLL